jgi:hypothetical protein
LFDQKSCFFILQPPFTPENIFLLFTHQEDQLEVEHDALDGKLVIVKEGCQQLPCQDDPAEYSLPSSTPIRYYQRQIELGQTDSVDGIDSQHAHIKTSAKQIPNRRQEQQPVPWPVLR